MRLSDDHTTATEYSPRHGGTVHVKSFTLAAKSEDLLGALEFAICAEYGFTYPHEGVDHDCPIGFAAVWEPGERSGWESYLFIRAPRDEIKRAVRDLRRTYRHIKATIHVDLWSATESVKNGLLAGDWVTCGDVVRGGGVRKCIAKVAGWRGQTMQVIHADIDTGRFDDEQYETLRRSLQVARSS